MAKTTRFTPKGWTKPLRHAKAEARNSAGAEAKLRGAAGDISVAVEVKMNNAHAAQTELLLGVSVTATAKGSIAL